MRTWQNPRIRSGIRNLFEIFRHAELVRVRIPAPGSLVNRGHELHKVLEQTSICSGKTKRNDKRPKHQTAAQNMEMTFCISRAHIPECTMLTVPSSCVAMGGNPEGAGGPNAR